MKTLFTLLIFLLVIKVTFSQSKKEQIEILTNRVDSLNRIVYEERSSNQNKIIEINSVVTKLEGQIVALSSNLATLNKELQNSKDDILKKQKEIVENQIEISRLQSALKIKSDSLEIVKKEETEETKIVENIDLNDWRDDYHVGEYFKDTLMYIDGGIGARIAYDFVDKKGNDYRFGSEIDDFDLFNIETGEQNPKYLNKIFLVGHRLMISKGYDNDDFNGDKAIDIVTTIEFLENETPFKLSEQEKLIEAYKKKYKYTYARYTEYSFGDFAHHIFIDDKKNEYDFMSFEDRTYDLTVEDPNSDFGNAMNLKYKNKYFHIFTKSGKMNDGWGELTDIDVVVKMILAE